MTDKPAKERKHGRGCYARPCEFGKDCQARKDAARVDQAARRKRAAEQRAREGKPARLSIVKPLPAEAPTPAPRAAAQPAQRTNMGTVGKAIAAEIDAIPAARTGRPGLVALIESLADLIDVGDPKERVTAAREIGRMMAELRPVKVAEPVKDVRAELLAAIAMPL